MLELKMTTEQQTRVRCTPVTPKGKPAPLDGKVSFTCENPDVVINEVDDNSADILAPETPGDITIVASADADLGSGVVTIQDVILIHVSDPQAASLGLSADEPVEKP